MAKTKQNIPQELLAKLRSFYAKGELMDVERQIKETNDAEKAALYWINLAELKQCGDFQPSGYPESDRCKKCGKWTITRQGLNYLAKEAQRRGSLDSIFYRRCLSERREAIAHGVIGEDEFPIAKLEKLILAHREKKQALQPSSDISVDQDISSQYAKKTSKPKAKLYKLHSAQAVRNLAIGSIVFYGENSKTKKSRLKSALVLKKNIVRNKSKAQSSLLLRDLKTEKELWVLRDSVWTETKIDDKSDWEQVSGGDSDFTEEEQNVNYVGNHV